jgi:hypothetical protein
VKCNVVNRCPHLEADHCHDSIGVRYAAINVQTKIGFGIRVGPHTHGSEFIMNRRVMEEVNGRYGEISICTHRLPCSNYKEMCLMQDDNCSIDRVQDRVQGER